MRREGFWEAVHAPEKASVEDALNGTPVFRTTADAVSAGDHEWEMWDAEQNSFRHLGACSTTLL